MRTNTSARRFAVRAGVTLAAIGTLALSTAGIAAAHVSASTDKPATQGGRAKIIFRVPNEVPTANTTKLEILFPTDKPVTSARTRPIEGWTSEVTKTKLDKPIKSGTTEVTEAIKSVTWTSTGGKIGKDQFQEFEVTASPLPTGTDSLVLPAIQSYDNGEVVKWDEIAAPGAAEPKHPAPKIALAAAPAATPADDHGMAAGSDKGETHPTSGDTTARALGAGGLVVGLIGIAVGVLGFRRKSAAPAEVKETVGADA
jgi:uncharacterized protein YcnI